MRIHKVRRTLLSLFPVFVFVFIVTRTPDEKYNHHDLGRTLCINRNLAVTSPPVDGLLIDNKVPPSEWKSFDTKQQNDTDKRIFYHETSGRIDLTMRQTCSIESTAKYNPDWSVHLFFRPSDDCTDVPSSDNTDSPSISLYNPLWLDILSHYPNVAAILMNQDHYFAETPLEEWYEKGEWRRSPHSKFHLSDYIRILTLYKGGGLYLDMDIVSFKAFKREKFHNCLSYDSASKDVLCNGVIHLERGHWLSVEIMRLLSEEYDPEDYAYHGPQALSAVMQSKCGMMQGDPSSNNCRDLRLLSSRNFFPIERPFFNVFYETSRMPPGSDFLAKMNKSYGAHLWNSMAGSQKPLDINSDQVFPVIARRNCPLTMARASQFREM